MTVSRAEQRSAPDRDAGDRARPARSPSAAKRAPAYRSVLLSLSAEAKERVLRPVQVEVAGVVDGYERD